MRLGMGGRAGRLAREENGPSALFSLVGRWGPETGRSLPEDTQPIHLELDAEGGDGKTAQERRRQRKRQRRNLERWLRLSRASLASLRA